ncbi:MAG: hypothetical protein AAGF73_08970 [Actinomycetota bacterium]
MNADTFPCRFCNRELRTEAARKSHERSHQPDRLDAGGQSLWRDVTNAYTLRPDELRLLEDACRERDLIDKLDGALVNASLTAAGSTGQIVIHPLIAEIRLHRTVFASLCARLKLPDEPEPDGRRNNRGRFTSVSGRRAAISRWRHQ